MAPLFFMILFGIIEFAFVFRDELNLDAATHRGARIGAIQGDALGSDQELLEGVEHFLEISDRADDVRIVVFNPGSAGLDGEPTAACKAGLPSSTPDAQCNVYAPGDVDDDSSFGCASSAKDVHWCPSDREVVAGAADYVGVWVRVEHAMFTGFFGDDITLTAQSITRIEPQEFPAP